MSNKFLTPVLDTGHGGVINGVYQTLGKRSPNWSKGVLYEGAANRWIAAKVMQKLDYDKLPYYHVSPEHEDISLTVRSNRTNKIYKKNKNIYGVSIHFNAGRGTGWEIFTSPGETMSDSIADVFIEEFKAHHPLKARLGGTKFLEKDKEANFSILRRTNCPFILLELGFMDNPSDYEKLWNEDFQDLMADMIVSSVKQVNSKYGK